MMLLLGPTLSLNLTVLQSVGGVPPTPPLPQQFLIDDQGNFVLDDQGNKIPIL